jgi:hypothetical protein
MSRLDTALTPVEAPCTRPVSSDARPCYGRVMSEGQGGGKTVSIEPARLKAVLRQKHLQTHSAFCREYDRVARKIDPELAGTWPSRAQFHRWLSGELKGLPYPHHCRVLEKMCPGWTAEQLFEPGEGETEPPAADASPIVPAAGVPLEAAVAATPISIRPYVEAAFDREHVVIDFFGFSG